MDGQSSGQRHRPVRQGGTAQGPGRDRPRSCHIAPASSSAAARAFSGADITEFGQTEQPPSWSDFDRRLDLSDKPIVAAIHEPSAAGWSWRSPATIGSPTAPSSLPFLKWGSGIIPGSGGTQRFPALPVSKRPSTSSRVPESLALRKPSSSASSIGASKASSRGGHRFRPGDHRQGIKGADLPRARNRNEAIETARANPQMFAKARETVKRPSGFNARLRAIDAIEKVLSLSFDEGFRAEIAIFDDCVKTAEHRALSHLFFAEREARRCPICPKAQQGARWPTWP
jgi:3-hydroxyacyl-CoA dehydrogenase